MSPEIIWRYCLRGWGQKFQLSVVEEVQKTNSFAEDWCCIAEDWRCTRGDMGCVAEDWRYIAEGWRCIRQDWRCIAEEWRALQGTAAAHAAGPLIFKLRNAVKQTFSFSSSANASQAQISLRVSYWDIPFDLTMSAQFGKGMQWLESAWR